MIEVTRDIEREGERDKGTVIRGSFINGADVVCFYISLCAYLLFREIPFKCDAILQPTTTPL